ncbi:MAG: ABC transporter permease [Corynebacterium sp.]|nr:ABC transporter permease [Corynebacterium sp.]
MTRTLATARRVAAQLLHDPRTLALVLVLPSVLLCLFRYVFDDSPATFQQVGPQMLGLFPFILMFLLTSVTMVRERTSGTLERLLTTRLRRGEFIAGYALAFGAAGLVQATVTSAVGILFLGLEVDSPWVLVVFAVANALLGTSLGLLASAFARTEFQAVQFMPLVVIPQLLLCGLLAPRDSMAVVLTRVSDVLPLSYAADSFTRLTHVSGWNADFTVDLAVVLGFTVVSVALAALTLRRRTA